MFLQSLLRCLLGIWDQPPRRDPTSRRDQTPREGGKRHATTQGKPRIKDRQKRMRSGNSGGCSNIHTKIYLGVSNGGLGLIQALHQVAVAAEGIADQPDPRGLPDQLDPLDPLDST